MGGTDDDRRRTILYLYEGAFALWRRRLRGIYVRARQHGWHVEPVNADGDDFDSRRLLRYWRPDGVVIDGDVMSRKGFRSSDFREMPMVYCDVNRETVKAPYYGVVHDSTTTVEKALAELFSLDRRAYAYVHYVTPQAWSDARARFFLDETRSRGVPAKAFDSCRMAAGADSRRFIGRLAAFLASLPKPCGVLAANDEMAAQTLVAAREAGLAVPEEIAVVGIDNDELLCENTEPTLTSVAPDFERSGRMAVDLLARCLAENGERPEILRYGCAPLERRRSTCTLKVSNAHVQKALEFIRLNACKGISVGDVVSMMGLRPRTAETRFRQTRERSIRDEIISVRVHEAKRLLSETDLPVAVVAERCGYRDERSLRYVFEKLVGDSPNAWRRTSGAAGRDA